MDIMEQLLCPQISMDVEDTPIDLGNNHGVALDESEENDLSDDEKIKMLMEVTDFDVAQIPKDLTEEEVALKLTLFSVGPPVEQMKLHCTSCNTHLGSAPINQFERFIHPVLNVLQCKSCYEFCCSGDFEKDEDGSEMYCRWCGQGGNVMCCSDCAFVFCQKCVRQNLGKKAVATIKSKDDWQCFSCNPQQLINLKLICHSLYFYTRNEIEAAKETQNVENLKIDRSLCCGRQGTSRATKRKRCPSKEDTPFDPTQELQSTQDKKRRRVVAKKPHIVDDAPSALRNALICTPDMHQMLNRPKPPDNKKPILSLKMLANSNHSNMGRNPVAIAPKPKAPIIICASTNKPLQFMSNKGSKMRGIQNFMPSPQPFEIRGTIRKINLASRNPTKHEWFDQASSITLNITQNLTQKISKLTADQANAISVEQLAAVHNQLQELLSSSVNQLIHVRKNLRNQFLSDLNKLKSNSKYVVTKHPAKPISNLPKNDEVIVIGNDDEDPLVLPTKDNSINNNLVTNTPVVNNSGNYIKVKPVSALMNNTNFVNDTRITEPIDLCDDDDDEPIVSVNEKSVVDEGTMEVVEVGDVAVEEKDSGVADIEKAVEDSREKNDVEEEKQEEAVDGENTGKIVGKDEDNEGTVDKQEEIEKGVNECAKEIKSNCEVDGLNGVDMETYREIQRALVESKFESIVEENSKLVFSDVAMSQKQINRALSVRVVLDPDYEPMSRRISTNSNNSECQDFEAMLSGSIVVNTAKLISDIENNSEDETDKNNEQEKVTEDERESDGQDDEREGNVSEEKMDTDDGKNVKSDDELDESQNVGGEGLDHVLDQRSEKIDECEEKDIAKEMPNETDYEEPQDDLLDDGKIEGLIDNLDSDSEEIQKDENDEEEKENGENDEEEKENDEIDEDEKENDEAEKENDEEKDEIDPEEIVNNSSDNEDVNNAKGDTSMPTENIESSDSLQTKGNDKTEGNTNNESTLANSNETSVNNSKESEKSSTFTLNESEETSTEMHVRDIIDSLTSDIDEAGNFNESLEVSTDPVTTTDSGIEVDTK